jgi:hypothetical protein
MGEIVINGERKTYFPSLFTINTYTGHSIRAVWGSVCAMLQKGLLYSRGELDLVSLREALLAEKFQLWTFARGEIILTVMLTELRQYPLKKSCNMVLVAGQDLAEIWPQLLPYMKTWLKANDVMELQTTCRESVARISRSLGFREAARVMIYDLKE